MNKTCYNNILLPPTPAPSPGAFAPAQCLSLLLKVEGNVASNSKQDLPQVQQMSNKTCTQALTDNGPRYGSKEHWGFPMVYWCLLSKDFMHFKQPSTNEAKPALFGLDSKQNNFFPVQVDASKAKQFCVFVAWNHGSLIGWSHGTCNTFLLMSFNNRKEWFKNKN